MTEAFICDAIRTPVGRYNGGLAAMRVDDLAAHPIKALMQRNANVDWGGVDDVIYGCANQAGEDNRNAARMAALLAGFPQSVPGVTVNRLCASGLEAVNQAARMVRCGDAEVVLAGGVESMSRVGIGASGGAWAADPSIAIPAFFMPQGISADLIATKYGFSRQAVDAYAVESQKRADHAWREGRFQHAVVPVNDINGLLILDHDEHRRPETTLETLSGLKPSFAQLAEQGGFGAVALQAHPEVEALNHVHHAGNSSGIVDGAAAVLIGSREAGLAIGLKPRAKIRAFANIGSDPALMLTGPVDVTRKLLHQSGFKISDIDLFEVNEAFASVVLRYLQAFDLDPARVNVNGGAIAMGHPLGATGAILLGTVLDELERSDKSTALITLCIGAGMGTATLIERV
mgnify:CR=1 FL=1